LEKQFFSIYKLQNLKDHKKFEEFVQNQKINIQKEFLLQALESSREFNHRIHEINQYKIDLHNITNLPLKINYKVGVEILDIKITFSENFNSKKIETLRVQYIIVYQSLISQLDLFQKRSLQQFQHFQNNMNGFSFILKK
jgi:hypothetical protein